MKLTTPFQHQRTIHTNVLSNFGQEKKRVFKIHPLELQEEIAGFSKAAEERLSCYEILWIKTAFGFLKIDAKTYPVSSNTVFCLVPGQVRNYMLEEGAEGYRIVFSPDFLFIGSSNMQATSWLDNYGTDTNIAMIRIDPELQLEIDVLIYAMHKEFANYSLSRADILSGLLNILLIHFSRKMNQDEPALSLTKDNELVRNFKTLLKEHFISKKLVADYASDLCVTPNYLNKTVKKITGFTASYHIQQKIILEAKRHAIHSNGSMKEIAYFLGFDNLAHFSKFFKNNSGMNFSTFKRGLIIAD